MGISDKISVQVSSNVPSTVPNILDNISLINIDQSHIDLSDSAHLLWTILASQIAPTYGGPY